MKDNQIYRLMADHLVLNSRLKKYEELVASLRTKLDESKTDNVNLYKFIIDNGLTPPKSPMYPRYKQQLAEYVLAMVDLLRDDSGQDWMSEATQAIEKADQLLAEMRE